jgi:hypothetical protein
VLVTNLFEPALREEAIDEKAESIDEPAPDKGSLNPGA